MHFYYLVALKIVLPNACVQNYQNKNSIISSVRLSLLSPLSSYTHMYFYKNFYENCCVLQRLGLESRFLLVRSTLCFLNDFWIFEFIRKHLTGTINRGGGWKRTVTNTKLSTKKCYWIPRGVLLCLLEFAKWRAMRAMPASVVYVPTC